MESLRHKGAGAGRGLGSLHVATADVDTGTTVQLGDVPRAVQRTQKWLLAQQHAEGYWEAELEGDSILESEYLLLLAYLGRHRTPVAIKAANHILAHQRPDGSWGQYPGSAIDISASVKAYFALKLTGHDPNALYMQRARGAILAAGGADVVNSFTRFYLALLGQISYDQCPAVPPETVLLPRWFPINLYTVSSWTRTMLVPLSVMSACQPVAAIPKELGIAELFHKAPRDWPLLRCPGLKGSTGPLSWDRFFRVVDRVLHACQRWKLTPLRRRALKVAERWMIDRFADSDGLGAIFPPMVWSIIALRCLGYADDSPEMRYCHQQLDGLLIEEENSVRLQPCKSPVWDTAITLRALAAGGTSPQHPAVQPAVQWLLDRQILRAGDWAETTAALPGGWCFEHANAFYPDLDDTAMVLMALVEQFTAPSAGHAAQSGGAASRAAIANGNGHGKGNGNGAAHHVPDAATAAMLARATRAIERGEQWILAMQNRDGGWGAFDRDNDHEFLCHVPFADHNAMIDPSTPDLSARVIESLGQLGHRVGSPAVDRAVAYLRATQEPDGSWFGRWGVNYIYGTWQAILGLRAVGVPADDPAIVAGARWLLAAQQPSGAWGESPDSYADPSSKGRGPATPSQTAWAVLGLLAADLHDHPATQRGVAHLLETQLPDGTWVEREFTGTGFPQVFYLRYHWYAIYFPLLALSRYSAAAGLPHPTDRPAPQRDRAGMNLGDPRFAHSHSALPTKTEDPAMRFPLSLTRKMATYLLRKKLSGERRFPLVLMLEPLHACNLTCTGCGRIREYATTIRDKLSIDECLQSVDECGAPIVSICGGEPMIYPGIEELVARILERNKHVYLCTNGMFIRKKLAGFRADRRFFFNVHLDGMEQTHDMAVEREGVFQEAIEGIKAAKEAGFLVCSNTTIYKETDMHEIAVLLAYLTELGVDGFMMSPAYGYSAVQQTNPLGAQQIFMTRDDIHAKFREAKQLLRRFKLNTSPIYMEFLRGERDLKCAAWANPTRNVGGWKGPCYLITDTHHKTYQDLVQLTDWDKLGRGNDPRCEHCMVHCGFEPAAVLGVNKRLGDTLKMALWQLT